MAVGAVAEWKVERGFEADRILFSKAKAPGRRKDGNRSEAILKPGLT